MSKVSQCIPPKAFLAFSQQAASRRQQAEQLDSRQLFDSPTSIRPQKLFGLFAGGIAMALAARYALGKVLPKAFKKTVQSTLRQSVAVDEKQIFTSFNKEVASLVKLVYEQPSLIFNLAAYAGIGVVGYLSGSLAQGVQETWVRREETRIRASLVSKLKNVFQESIRTKQDIDDSLRQNTRQHLGKLLKSYGIKDIDKFLMETPIEESLQVQNDYFFEPTHRTVKPVTAFGQTYAGANTLSKDSDSIQQVKKMIEAGVFGLGAAATGMVMAFTERLKGKAAQRLAKQSVAHGIETINLMNLEAMVVSPDKRVLATFLGLAAIAKLGQLAVDGLRQIEVTRVNAITEYDYQSLNWLRLDPGYHRIAEQEAVDSEVAAFRKRLPRLVKNRLELQKNVQAILNNIGRHSAPPYYLMTPPVALVDARS